MPSELIYLSPVFVRIYAIKMPEECATLYPPHVIAKTRALTTLEMPHQARVLKITEPKDRIHAFMAMPTLDNVMDAWRVRPDYTTKTSHLDVYRDFAVQFLEKTLNLDILSFVEHKDSHVGCLSNVFPSWVPRWDQGDDVMQMIDMNN